MKRLVDVLLLAVGLWLLVQGIRTVNAINDRNDTVVGKIALGLNNSYTEKSQDDLTIGYLMAIGGGILVLLGIKRLFERPKSNSKLDVKEETALDYLYRKLNTVVKEGDYRTGIAVLHKILNIDPTSKEAYFNLACLHSLTHNEESLYALSKAIENGYTNTEKIKSYPDLSWIRQTPRFKQFVQNGYKFAPVITQTVSSEPVNPISDSAVAQLERWGKLKEQGLITNEEYQIQKAKILGL